jgi:hypothetical protein
LIKTVTDLPVAITVIEIEMIENHGYGYNYELITTTATDCTLFEPTSMPNKREGSLLLRIWKEGLGKSNWECGMNTVVGQ